MPHVSGEARPARARPGRAERCSAGGTSQGDRLGRTRARGRSRARGGADHQVRTLSRPGRTLDVDDDVVGDRGICDRWQGDGRYRRTTHSTRTGAVLWLAELVLWLV